MDDIQEGVVTSGKVNSYIMDFFLDPDCSAVISDFWKSGKKCYNNVKSLTELKHNEAHPFALIDCLVPTGSSSPTRFVRNTSSQE